ncbi:MAG TPA: hypothetical protein VNY27_05775 [Solirubrobacteraceae bacterium]|nr:hypothetical protein [Solirubrobacteraceae bacterium]
MNTTLQRVGIGALDPHDQLADRQNILEVDQRGRHSRLLCVSQELGEQRRLSVAPRADHAQRVAALNQVEHLFALTCPVDDVRWRPQRPSVAKGLGQALRGGGRRERRVIGDPSYTSTTL